MFKRFIGDRQFYRRTLSVAIPIIIQNGITNFVSLLDNIMVGQIGTMPMSGVSIVNQLLFIFNLCVFGASSGAGIFTAQFHGSGDHKGITHTFRFKVLACSLISLVGIGVFSLLDSRLIGLYLTGEGDPLAAREALLSAQDYLAVMLWGLVPFALSTAYAGTLRECGQTTVPMVAGICAVFVNLALNYCLIFGHFGMPAMGVRGAALATVISRYVELAVVAGWTHLHATQQKFIRGAYRSFYIPGKLLRGMITKGMPLMINEFFWSMGIATMNQAYSTCGLEVVPAMNISSVLFNLGSVAFMALGSSVGIIMGQMLGAGVKEAELRDTNRKLVALSVASGVFFGAVLAVVSPFFPRLYNAESSVRDLATALICITACAIPFNSYTNSAYFTLRSGGQTLVTFLFDSCFVWGICVPLAYCLSRFARLPIIPLYIICQSAELLKCTLGYIMIRQGKWIQNLTK